MVDVAQVVDTTLRMAQAAGLRRRAWLLQQTAWRLRSARMRALPVGLVPPLVGLAAALVAGARLDVYA